MGAWSLIECSSAHSSGRESTAGLLLLLLLLLTVLMLVLLAPLLAPLGPSTDMFSGSEEVEEEEEEVVVANKRSILFKTIRSA